MIAHVAAAGEGSGRVILQVTSGPAADSLLAAAVQIARAFQSEIESLVVEDRILHDIAQLPFTREVCLSGRHRRPLSADDIARHARFMAQELERRVAALAREAEVPTHLTLVQDEPLHALSEACATRGPWNVVVVGEPLTAGLRISIADLVGQVNNATGVVVAGPRARVDGGPVVVALEDAADVEPLLRIARRLMPQDLDEPVHVHLVTETIERRDRVEGEVRLLLGDDRTVHLLVGEPHEDCFRELARHVQTVRSGLLIARFGGDLLPDEAALRRATANLVCPLLLTR